MTTHDFSVPSQIDPEVIAKRLQSLENKTVAAPVSINGYQIDGPAIDARLTAATGVVVANNHSGAAPDRVNLDKRLKAAGK